MKGPKEVFAEYVAYELSEYMVVDPKHIQSSLLLDTKLVLQNVQLKEQTMALSSSTTATMTGVIDLITFKWKWTVHGWMKDCVLTLLGMKVKVKLSTLSNGGTSLLQESSTTSSVDQDATESESNMDLYIDRQIQNVIDSLTLRVKTYQITIEMPLSLQHQNDSSTSVSSTALSNNNDTISILFQGKSLDIACTESEKSDDNKDQSNKEEEKDEPKDIKPPSIDQRLVLSSLSAKILVISKESQQQSYTLMEPFCYNAQVSRRSGWRFESLMTGLVVVGGGGNADTSDKDNNNGNIVFHAGAVQLQALTQLADMVTTTTESDSDSTDASDASAKDEKPAQASAKDEKPAQTAASEKDGGSKTVTDDEKQTDGAGSKKERTIGSETVKTAQTVTDDEKQTPSAGSEKESTPGSETAQTVTDDEKQTDGSPSAASETQSTHGSETVETAISVPSVFDISICSLAVTYMEKVTVTVSGIHAKYNADGTLLNMEAQRIDLDSTPSETNERGLQAGVSGIKCCLLPDIAVNIDSIETAHVPGVLDLTKELRFPSIKFDGDTLFVDVTSTVEATILNKTEPQDNATAASSASKLQTTTESNEKKSSDTQGAVVPLPMRVSFHELKLTEETDNSSSLVKAFDIAFCPQNTKEFVGTAVAAQVGGFENDLLQCQNASASVVIPEKDITALYDFNFDADSIHVQSGYSVEDWAEQFEPSELRQLLQAKQGPLKLPFAKIAALKIEIAFKGTGVSVKDTAVNVKAFHGKANTTTKDIVDYYARACARRVSGFISNAEVGGHNVVESTAITAGACAGLEELGGPTAVAALASVDSAKTLLARGKESRDATADDKYKVGDFSRGILKTPAFLAKKGAKVRGNKDGQGDSGVAAGTDMALGAVSTVGNYTVDNEARLGAAFAGGIGVLGGAAIGGPIGAIIGGIVAGAIADKLIKAFDKSAIGKKANARIKEDLGGTLLSKIKGRHHHASQNDQGDSSATIEEKDHDHDHDHHSSHAKKHDHKHGLSGRQHDHKHGLIGRQHDEHHHVE